MNQVATRSLLLVLSGFVLLLLQSALSVVVALHPFVPNVILPIVIFLGVAPDVHIARGALIAFTLGYLLDLFSGNLMSMQTFLSVATFLIARGAGIRFVLRGPAFQATSVLIVQFILGGAAMALRAVFRGNAAPFSADGYEHVLYTLVPPAIATALIAPLVFALVQRVEGVPVKKQEGAAT